MGVKNTITDEELVETVRVYASCGENQTRAAEAMGIPRPTLQGRLREAERRGLKSKQDIQRRDETIRVLKKRVEQLEKDYDTAAKIREQIHQIAAHDPEPPRWLQGAAKAGTRGIPVLLASDWHHGEVVRPEEVGGVNEFNSEVSARRIKKLVTLTTELCYEHMGRAKYSYEGMVFALGGDMISGDIHEELLATNDKTPQQCVNDLTDLLAGAIEHFAGKFGKLFIPCVVGNHGRGTRKPRMKGRVFTSFEWNIYCNLAREFKRSKHIQFLIPEDTDAYFKVYGHRYLLTHGDSLGVKGGDGIIGALGPIMRGAIKVSRSEAQIGRDFDTIVMGHWHQYLTLPGIVVNNSLKGYDEFARLALRAPYSRPSQALWFTHPTHGVTAHWQVYLEPERRAPEDKQWVSVLETK